MNKEIKQLIILASMTILILFSSGLANIFSEERGIESTPKIPEDQGAEIIEVLDPQEPIEDSPKIPKPVTGLMIGFDESGGLTDVMMLGYLDTASDTLKIISIPRDLHIDFRTERFKAIRENNPKIRVDYCKLNEVYAYGGWDDRALMDVEAIVSIITGLEIDYLATIDIEGFSKVVDAIGGVDFYVPQRMYYYDPVADFLIDLREGQQILDGDKAIQLVRYRQYRMGDLQRIQVQQDFIRATYQQVVSQMTFDKILELTKIAYDIVDTNFGLFDVLAYIEYIYDLGSLDLMKPEHMMTIPSYGELIDDIWYQYIHEEEAKEMLDALLNPEKYVPSN